MMSTNPLGDLDIHLAAGADLPGVLELLRLTELTEAGIADHIDSLLVAYDGPGLAGSAGLELYGSVALLRSVAVQPSLQKRGLGRRLTEAALDLAQRHGVRTLYLLTETAASFYLQFGFRTIAREAVPSEVRQSVEFVSACPESAIVMVLDLTERPESRRM